MAFDRDFLLEYNEMPQTPLEMAESIDMLRIIEHGKKIKMVETSYDTYSVDTPKDKAKVEEVMKMDPLFQLYKKVYR